MFAGREKAFVNFWFGVIEDRLDPLELGRCRVRILGYHPEIRENFPTDKLPWATIIQQAGTAALNGKGTSPVGLVEGSWVVGFFLDGEAAQLPMIIGSIYGMNETIKPGENFGDGFADVREDDILKVYPVDKFQKRLYPNGLMSDGVRDGDSHGAQLENEDKTRKYPRPEYSPDSSGRERGTPDLNILAINDPKRLNKTVVDLKRKPLWFGGLRETFVDVADNQHPLYKCGVTNESKVNKGTIKKLGKDGQKSNAQDSSSVSSRKTKYKQFVEKPTNNNGITVDSSKTMEI